METKTTILNTAERFARTRGFDAFSYADLSREVGIKKASIHYHYPTKSDLALALINRYAKTVLSRLDEIADSEQSGADQLRAYLTIYRDAMDEGRQLCLCVSFSASRDSFETTVQQRLNQFHDNSIAWLESAFALGASDGSIGNAYNAKSEAAACLALAEGAQLLARAARDVTRFDHAVAAFLSRLGPRNE